MKSFKLFLFSLYLLSIPILFAQEHDHEHSQNEIGVSGGATYSPDHKEWGTGMHIHYYRTLKPHGKWALGGSFESELAGGEHINISLGAKYQILENLSFAVLPGIMIPSHSDEIEHGSTKPKFSMHFETVYDLFHWKKFHLGPVLDYSWTKKDSHLMAGIHLAYAF